MSAIDHMMRRGRVSARHAIPLKTRIDSHYSDTRGGKERHCGNCKHFVKPNACTEVGGVIVRMGLCDWWKPKG